MKKITFICLVGFLTFFGYSKKLYAADEVQQQAQQVQQQDRDQDREAFRQRVQAQRIAFFTERLALTPEEAERFWPLYNTFQREREQLISEFNRKTRVRGASGERAVFDVSNLSDEEVQRLVDNRAKQIDLERRFHDDLTKLFSPQRVLAFYDAERSFQRELVDARTRVRVTTIDTRRGQGGRER
ncbi:MAG: hypothetical protein FWD02_02515 [Bacteroidales bacterium]|nr:hypothetical protein [Bacteroidales bacterium]